MLEFLDGRDIIYTTVGLALMGLTLQPGLARFRLFNLPLIYLAIGAGFGLAGAPLISPLAGDLSVRIVEHASELIVIISLTGAGLAIDTQMTWRNWLPTWRLLMITMPLTIVAIAALGSGVLGLGLASALLLAAALAPTDPVLARAVQVTPPGREETPIQVALT